MVNESVYVAVAIACVVALLLIAVIVIYCIKRHQDKEQSRQAREERERRERHRREIRGHIGMPMLNSYARMLHIRMCVCLHACIS